MEQRQLFLRDVLTVLFKRKVLIVGVALVVIVLVFVGNMIWPETYESSAKIQVLPGIETMAQPTVVAEKSTQVVNVTEDNVNSEIEILNSDDVLREVAKQFEGQLMTSTGSPLRNTMNSLQQSWNGVLESIGLRNPGTSEEIQVELLRNAIVVRHVKDSLTIQVMCRLGSPQLAQDVLIALGMAYRDKRREVYAAEGTVEVFTDLQGQAREGWNQAQEDLRQFRDDNDVYELNSELELLTEKYTLGTQAQVQLRELEVATEAIEEGANGEGVIAVLSRETPSTVITELRLRLLELILRRNETSQSKGPNHPEMIGVIRQIDKAVQSLQNALANETTRLDERLVEMKTRLEALGNVTAQHDLLEKNAELKADEYEFFSERLREAVAGKALRDQQVDNVRVISSASLPIQPIRPRKGFNMIIGLIAGIVGGIGLAFLLEYVDHGVKTPEDIEHYLNVPPLASYFHSRKEQLDPKESSRLNSMLDAIYTDTPLKLVAVGSSIGGEASHRVARALADASAGDPSGHTLLIDFEGGAIPEAPSGRGLVDVLLGDAESQDVVTNAGDLYLMGKGSQGDCPAYLWHSDRMQTVMEDLKSRFKRIIFHVPPVLSAADAVNLSRYADGTLLVIKSDSTRREVAMRAMETLADAKGRVVGAVLTDRRQVIPKAVYKRI
jgi:uncharacterized protein involved in exopolysaccharide biosynthesis